MNTQLNHLVPMDFENAVDVPASHTWDSLSSNASSSEESIPIIDLEDPEAVNKIKTACENWGAFQVKNHAVPLALLAEIEHQARSFFALPKEKKILTLRSPGIPSRPGYGIIPASSAYSSLMWMEGFTVSDTPEEQARLVWPEDYSPFCTAVEDYKEQLKGLAIKITSLIVKALGMSEEDVDWLKSKNTSAFLHFNSYPTCPDPTRALGMVPHTDSSLITLLYQSNTNTGLQVFGRNKKWVDVKPIPDALVVNVSDMMQIFSNGHFKSVKHRAVVSQTSHRISITYFFGPEIDLKISSPAKLVKGRDSRYPPISWKEYRGLREFILIRPWRWCKPVMRSRHQWG
ncbi:PREDICTED: gibberellin 3-beta-dioxygenase 1-like [Ipomoea nil]|uniref:gibberellin 3-beta-dioxygenase 1-like n=1 Tax=Ipomoea nil TaxID=35883 RepID=UPI0009015BC7|nr:PREDICTED: gibberellin 3-beta-dioxygenase 1-like [Ipomoea nil]